MIQFPLLCRLRTNQYCQLCVYIYVDTTTAISHFLHNCSCVIEDSKQLDASESLMVAEV